MYAPWTHFCTKYVSMTTDIWTSTNYHHSFFSLTAHFVVSKAMEKKDVMLSAWQFDESHTGANILFWQPNPVFWHNLASESIVVFNVELAFHGHYFKESFYWTAVSIEHFA